MRTAIDVECAAGRSRAAVRPRVSRLIRPGAEEGSATIEFLALAVVLLVPLAYLMVFVSQVQASAFGAVAAADQAARVVVGGAEGSSAAQAHATVRMTLADYGITADLYEVQVRCSSGDCMTLEPGETAHVHVSVEVPLPLVPEAWGLARPLTLDAQSRTAVPRF